MDKQFKFCYKIWICKGRTEVEELSCESSPSNKIVSIGKSIDMFNWVTNESLLRDKLFGSFQFPGKISLWLAIVKIHILPYRIPTQVDRSSRLRRSGENWLRNSAKNLGVTFGRCLAAISFAVATKEYLATVYLKHRSLQSWKAKYRGWHLPSAGKSSMESEVGVIL